MKHLGLMCFFALFFVGFLQGVSAHSICGNSLQKKGPALAPATALQFIDNPNNFFFSMYPEIVKRSDNYVTLRTGLEEAKRILESLPQSNETERLARHAAEVYMETFSLDDLAETLKNPTWDIEISYLYFKAEIYRSFNFFSRTVKPQDYMEQRLSPEELEIIFSHPNFFSSLKPILSRPDFKRSLYLVNQFISKVSYKGGVTPFAKVFFLKMMHGQWNQKNGVIFQSRKERIRTYLEGLKPDRVLDSIYGFVWTMFEHRPDLFESDVLDGLLSLPKSGASRSKLLRTPKTLSFFTRALDGILASGFDLYFDSINRGLTYSNKDEAADDYGRHISAILKNIGLLRSTIVTNMEYLEQFVHDEYQWQNILGLISNIEPWLLMTEEDLVNNLNQMGDRLVAEIDGEGIKAQKRLSGLTIEINRQVEIYNKRLEIAAAASTRNSSHPDFESTARQGKVKSNPEVSIKAFGGKFNLPNEKTLRYRQQKREKKNGKPSANSESNGFKKAKEVPTLQPFRVATSRTYRKALEALPPGVVNEIHNQKYIETIRDNPFQMGKIKHTTIRELRVFGFSFQNVEYRLAYLVNAERREIVFYFIDSRGDFYEKLVEKYKATKAELNRDHQYLELGPKEPEADRSSLNSIQIESIAE